MIRNTFKLFALLTGSFIFSQTGTTSPYSYAGLGDVNLEAHMLIVLWEGSKFTMILFMPTFQIQVHMQNLN